MAVLNTALYDAWAAYHPRATPVVDAGWSRRTGPAVDRIEAMNQAALAAGTLLYPNSVDSFERRVARVRANHGTGSAEAQEFGAAVGRAAYEARAGDLQYANNDGGTPPNVNDPYAWRPLVGQPANGLYPRWGNVRPFGRPAGWQNTAPYTPRRTGDHERHHVLQPAGAGHRLQGAGLDRPAEGVGHLLGGRAEVRDSARALEPDRPDGVAGKEAHLGAADDAHLAPVRRQDGQAVGP
jgi:hypothetical protein